MKRSQNMLPRPGQMRRKRSCKGTSLKKRGNYYYYYYTTTTTTTITNISVPNMSIDAQEEYCNFI